MYWSEDLRIKFDYDFLRHFVGSVISNRTILRTGSKRWLKTRNREAGELLLHIKKGGHLWGDHLVTC